jgi:glutamine synthetase
MNMTNDESKAKVLEEAKRADVRLVSLQFVDIFGTLKSVVIPVEHLEEALDDGHGFDGSSIEGFVRIYESDMIAMPDPSTFRVLPWRPAEKSEARIICDILRPGGKPFEGDPRSLLKKALQELKQAGYVYNTGPELEFFLTKSDNGQPGKFVPHDQGGYFDFSPMDEAMDVRRQATFTLQQMGFDIEMSHHEVAPGQHEIDFKFEDALVTADNATTFKTVIKMVAQAYGLQATFMPKPFFGVNGSGMHVHQSLFEAKTGKNAFFDPKDQYKLSDLAFHFLGGQLKFVREVSGVLSPTVNSYKRLVPGYEAPVYICWASRNRSALIRVPEYFPGNEKATRFELRCPDSSCNPYLAFTVMLRAGMEGVRNKTEPPEPVEEDVYEFDDKKLAKFYIRTLPASLGEAVEELKQSKLARSALGDYIFDKFIEAKTKEWDEYRLQVSEWELQKYLQI